MAKELPLASVLVKDPGLGGKPGQLRISGNYDDLARAKYVCRMFQRNKRQMRFVARNDMQLCGDTKFIIFEKHQERR